MAAGPTELEMLLVRHMEAGRVLVAGAMLDDELEGLLRAAGRKISKKMAKDIFRGFGPLHTFSAKIAMAYFFELVDPQVYEDLRVIKAIHNSFAHISRHVFFASDEIADLCKNLSNHRVGLDSDAAFFGRVTEISQVLRRSIAARALKQELGLTAEDED